jgi:hypothetical protein
MSTHSTTIEYFVGRLSLKKIHHASIATTPLANIVKPIKLTLGALSIIHIENKNYIIEKYYIKLYI